MKKYNYYANLPPGPWGIPFLGYLLFMKKAPHTFYLEMAARYGDIFSLQLGNHLVVGIGSAKILKELFSRSDSIARPQTPLNALMEGHGIFLSEGLLWKKQRAFLHDKFRALGVRLSTNPRFEKCILMEVEEMLATLRASTNQPLDPVPVLGRHVHNIICQLMMSFRFVENDAEFELFNERVSRGMELYGAIHIGEYVKQYYYLPGKKAALEEISRNLRDISKFHMDHTTERIEMRANTLEPYEPADLLDHYLASLDDDTKSGEATNLFHNVDPKKQIVQVMNDLFSAGMETSRSTIAWTLVMMLREPQVAEKVRAELRETLEPDQLVLLEHRCKLPYLEACIYETLRMVSVVPLGTTHCNTTTWTVNNFTIPVGTHIIPLINKINMDPECYPEPGKFIPERFIKCGRLYIPEQFTAFGIGQRMCLGAQLAKIEVFLIFANIMNNFNFILPIGDKLPGLEGTLGVTHAPLPFRLCFAETASF